MWNYKRRSLHPVLTNLLEAMEAWTEALDEGLRVEVLFLDYRRAFDSVAHRKLIDKLQILGIQLALLALNFSSHRLDQAVRSKSV